MIGKILSWSSYRLRSCISCSKGCPSCRRRLFLFSAPLRLPVHTFTHKFYPEWPLWVCDARVWVLKALSFLSFLSFYRWFIRTRPPIQSQAKVTFQRWKRYSDRNDVGNPRNLVSHHVFKLIEVEFPPSICKKQDELLTQKKMWVKVCPRLRVYFSFQRGGAESRRRRENSYT